MLTIFTVCDRTYEPFVIPYAISALTHNPTACVEICLFDPSRFIAENRKALECVNLYFPDRFSLRAGRHFDQSINTVRFLEQPTCRSEYIYIGDIDMLILEEIAPSHIEHMEATGLPYSNILRHGRKALTGLHFSRWGAFYPQPPNVKKDRVNMDEEYLYDLVEARGLPMPDVADSFRPCHGFHLSINRDPRNARDMFWQGVGNSELVRAFCEFRESAVWREASENFDVRFQWLLSIVESVLSVRFPKLVSNSKATPGFTLRSLWQLTAPYADQYRSEN